MSAPRRHPDDGVRLAGRAGRSIALAGIALAAALATAPARAEGCVFHAERPPEGRGLADAVPIDRLEPGIARGWTRCGGTHRPLVVWTLETDPAQERLGVRDGPLFAGLAENPFVPLAAAEIGPDRVISLFLRADVAAAPGPASGGPDRRAPFRIFGTLCERGSETPLDCWAGAHRVKVRTDAEDRDRDGALDTARHQISIFDGARLQVLTFTTGHDASPLGPAWHWIEALEAAGLLSRAESRPQ